MPQTILQPLMSVSSEKKNQKLFRSKSFRLHFKKINKWLSGHLDIEKLKQFYEILSGHQKFSAMTTIFTQSHKFQ